MSTDAIVAIVMGGKSDFDTMSHAAEVLQELGVPYEIRVISAHRTPQIAHDFGLNAASRGIQVNSLRS